MRQRSKHTNATVSRRLVKNCGSFLNFLTALVAEFCAGTQFSMTVGTRGWSLFCAALDAELRTGRVLMTTLRTRHTGRLRGLRCGLRCFLSRLVHGVVHRARHRIAQCESGAETHACARDRKS